MNTMMHKSLLEARIKIVSLPPHLWTEDCFKEIGECCEGLKNIDQTTANLQDLSYDRIEVFPWALGTEIRKILGGTVCGRTGF